MDDPKYLKLQTVLMFVDKILYGKAAIKFAITPALP